jgi:hypothetical protein
MNEQYEDIELECVDCARAFIFTAGEQDYFARRIPPLNRPKRCAECRRARRQRDDREAAR